MSVSITLRPNFIEFMPAYVLVSGGGSVLNAISDNSDSTYIYNSSSVDVTEEIGLQTSTLPAGAQLKSGSVSLRSSSSQGYFGCWARLSGEAYYGSYVNTGVKTDNVARTYTSGDATLSGTQSVLDGLELYIMVLSGGTVARIYDVWATIKYNPLPSAPTNVGPTGTVNNTLKPTYVWTHDGTHEAQYSRHVKVFTDAVASGGGFDVDTSTAEINSSSVTSTQQFTSTQALTNGVTYWIYVKTAIATNGNIQWSTWSTGVSFNTNTDVGAPYNVTPAQGSIQTSARPFLDADGPSEASPDTKRQWQIASNSGFSTNVQLIDEGIFRANHTSAGPFAFPSSGVSLAQGTWYIRARFHDASAPDSWSGTQTFSVAHVPSATPLAPSNGASAQYATSVPLDWTYSDVYAGDNQTAYQIELWQSLDKAGTVIDTGKVVSSTSSATVGTIDATWKDVGLRWRVKVWDIDDVASEWSFDGFFHLRDLPVVTITAPTEGGTVVVSAPTITWTFSSIGGIQVGWRVIVTDEDAGSTVIADSGQRSGADLSWAIPDPVCQLSTNYAVQVLLTDAAGLTGTDTNNFTAVYVAPTTPTLVVDSSLFDAESSIFLDWSSSTVDVANSGWRVYRRIVGEVNWTLAYDGGTIPNVKSYTDYEAPANHVVEYGVAQVSDTFGLIESAKSTSTEDLTGLGGEYVLVVPENPSLNVVLRHVSSDQFAAEYETTTTNLVDRGRRIEHGTRYGQSGSLTAELRDVSGGLTARQQREAIEAVRDSSLDAYLRTPFGDNWKIAMASIRLDRVAGVGPRGHTTLTLSYLEETA